MRGKSKRPIETHQLQVLNTPEMQQAVGTDSLAKILQIICRIRTEAQPPNGLSEVLGEIMPECCTNRKSNDGGHGSPHIRLTHNEGSH